jgi:hypothetical protein
MLATSECYHPPWLKLLYSSTLPATVSLVMRGWSLKPRFPAGLTPKRLSKILILRTH